MEINEAYARRMDFHLEQSRRNVAAYIMAWRESCGLAQRDVEKLSRAASGRKRITGSSLNKLRLCVEAGAAWHPQASFLVGLDEVQELILAWTERGEWPPKLDPDLKAKVRPFLRADGRPMGRLDWFSAMVGDGEIIAAA